MVFGCWGRLHSAWLGPTCRNLRQTTCTLLERLTPLVAQFPRCSAHRGSGWARIIVVGTARLTMVSVPPPQNVWLCAGPTSQCRASFARAWRPLPLTVCTAGTHPANQTMVTFPWKTNHPERQGGDTTPAPTAVEMRAAAAAAGQLDVRPPQPPRALPGSRCMLLAWLRVRLHAQHVIGVMPGGRWRLGARTSYMDCCRRRTHGRM